MSEHLELIGEIIEVSRDKFKILIEEGNLEVLAQLSGKMRKNKIRVLLGDKVRVKVSPYNTSLGFIVERK